MTYKFGNDYELVCKLADQKLRGGDKDEFGHDAIDREITRLIIEKYGSDIRQNEETVTQQP